MFPTISATRIQRWWKSLTPCNGCGILIPRDDYNFNRCEICYHDRHEDSCMACISGLNHKWNAHVMTKQRRAYMLMGGKYSDDEHLSATYIPQTSDEE